jgi:pimeloyl-ACP methyl ester carboxylesterase
LPERVALADGASLALVRAGDPAAPVTVVLLHSYAQDHRVWHKVVDLLGQADPTVRVIAYDHRGHGDSTPAEPATATMEQLGDDLAELLAQTDGRLVLVGHGMGGHVALAAIARHEPKRVGGLVLLSTSTGLVAETSAALPRSVGRLVQDLHAILGPRIVGQVRQRIDKATTAGLRWLLLGDDPDPDDVRLVAEMIARHWPDTAALFHPALDRYDRAAALAVTVDTPVLAIVGERDRLVPAAHASALVSGNRRGHAVTLPGRGHMLPLEAAAQIVPRILGLVGDILRDG